MHPPSTPKFPISFRPRTARAAWWWWWKVKCRSRLSKKLRGGIVTVRRALLEGRLTANLSRAEATQETIMSAAVPRTGDKAVAA